MLSCRTDVGTLKSIYHEFPSTFTTSFPIAIIARRKTNQFLLLVIGETAVYILLFRMKIFNVNTQKQQWLAKPLIIENYNN